MTEQLLYRVEDAARVLSLGRSKTFELIASGQLRSVQIGRSRRVPRAALEEFAAQWDGAAPDPRSAA